MTSDDISKTTETTKTEVKWSATYDQDDADVELISSDGWHFKAHGYRLQTFSNVFRSMISMATSTAQRDHITFTDETMETARVIKMFLDAIYKGSVDGVGDTHRTAKISKLIVFARKWECEAVLHMIDREIRANVTSSRRDLLDQFEMAVQMEQYELAGDCLKYRPGMKWGNTEPGDIELGNQAKSAGELQELGGVSVFDLAAMSHQSFVALDPSVAWALLRSTRLAQKTQNGEEFEENLGDEFVKLMRIIHPLKPGIYQTASKKRARDEQ